MARKRQTKPLAYRRGASIFMNGLGEDISGTTELFYKLFRKNTDIKGCVTKLQVATGRSGYFFEKNGERIENDNFSKIFKQIRALKADIIQDLTVAGNAFVLPVRNAFGDIIEFETLDPRSIRIVANKHGEILKYIQKVGAHTEEYEADELYMLVDNKDPDNEIMGLSKIETLIYDVLGDNEAMISNYVFFKNNAIPNTIVILEDGITDDEYENAMKQLKEQFSGGANKHKVSTNTGIKDVKTIGQTHRDMEFVSLRQFTTEKVCSALGVPKTLLGYNDGVNYSTSDTNYRIFIEETVRPMEDLLAGFFTEILQKEWNDPSLHFYFIDDRDFDRTAKIDEYIKMLNNGLITIDEVRAEMGYDAFDIEATTKPIIKQGFEFVEDIGTGDLLPENTLTD